MFELTNEQRRCFALQPVFDTWKKVEVKASPYDDHVTYAFLDGQKIVKVIMVSDNGRRDMYREFGVDQMLSEDGTKILPKTDKGKPQNFTSSNLLKKTPVGMSVCFNSGYISVVNNTADQAFYRSAYNAEEPRTLNDFSKWVENWCRNTGKNELDEIANKWLNNEDIDKASVHYDWYNGFRNSYSPKNYDDAKEYIYNLVGGVCENVLRDAGVFKEDEKGRDGLKRFLNACGFEV